MQNLTEFLARARLEGFESGVTRAAPKRWIAWLRGPDEQGAAIEKALRPPRKEPSSGQRANGPTPPGSVLNSDGETTAGDEDRSARSAQIGERGLHCGDQTRHRYIERLAELGDGSALLTSHGKAFASMPSLVSAACAVSSRSVIRATRATEKPSFPNFRATASEMPGPKPKTMATFFM